MDIGFIKKSYKYPIRKDQLKRKIAGSCLTGAELRKFQEEMKDQE